MTGIPESFSEHLGVCSWSLQPRSPEDLVATVLDCGLRSVQLALDPIRRGEWNEDQTREALREAGITILSGMMAMEGEDYSTLETIHETGGVRPDHTHGRNFEAARANAAIARRLGLKLVTFHAGCIPDQADDPLRAAMLKRLRDICSAYMHDGISVAFETGQDPPRTVNAVLESLRDLNVGVNFDPANMILYGTCDPVDALELLAPSVKQIHIKDARRSQTVGTWGEETPAGQGDVDWSRFFDVVHRNCPNAPLVIERESGNRRVEDVRLGVQLIRNLRYTPQP